MTTANTLKKIENFIAKGSKHLFKQFTKKSIKTGIDASGPQSKELSTKEIQKNIESHIERINKQCKFNDNSVRLVGELMNVKNLHAEDFKKLSEYYNSEEPTLEQCEVVKAIINKCKDSHPHLSEQIISQSIRHILTQEDYDILQVIKDSKQLGLEIKDNNNKNLVEELYLITAIGNNPLGQLLNKNVITDNHKTPLDLAVEAKNISSIKALISKGAKFDIKSELGYKIFDLAINSEDVRLIEYLVNHTLVGKNTGQQTLLEKVTQIHDKNINISKLVKVLIKNNDSKFDKALGQKLLNIAVYADDLELVETLYNSGINVEYKDQLGRTALNHAIKANCGEELLQFLIEHVTDINCRDKSGSTPLHWAANNHHTIATKLLLEAEACAYISDYLGQTPLSLAEYYGHDDIADILGAVVHGA